MRDKLVAFWNIFRRISLLKSIYYSCRFHGKVLVGGGRIVLNNNAKILFLGKDASLWFGVNNYGAIDAVLTIAENGTLIVGRKVCINRGTRVSIYRNATLLIGNDTFINEDSKIYCRSRIDIGTQCAIGWSCTILDTDIHRIYRGEDYVNQDRAIHIGDHVWIGSNSTILKGANIESNVVIASGTMVRGECASGYVYGGEPMKKMNQFDKWIL